MLVGGFFENSHLQNQDDQAALVHFFGMPFMHLQSNKGGPSVCAIFKRENLSKEQLTDFFFSHTTDLYKEL